MLKISEFFIFATIFYCVQCLPTVYKFNENQFLEPDLVAVSSTVIPLPVYQVVSKGINVAPTFKDEKIKKPDGPITLVTVHTKKKATDPVLKLKPQDVSIIKEVNKKVFDN